MYQSSQLVDALTQPLLGPKLPQKTYDIANHEEVVTVTTVVTARFECGANPGKHVPSNLLKYELERCWSRV